MKKNRIRNRKKKENEYLIWKKKEQQNAVTYKVPELEFMNSQI